MCNLSSSNVFCFESWLYGDFSTSVLQWLNALIQYPRKYKWEMAICFQLRGWNGFISPCTNLWKETRRTEKPGQFSPGKIKTDFFKVPQRFFVTHEWECFRRLPKLTKSSEKIVSNQAVLQKNQVRLQTPNIFDIKKMTCWSGPGSLQPLYYSPSLDGDGGSYT